MLSFLEFAQQMEFKEHFNSKFGFDCILCFWIFGVFVCFIESISDVCFSLSNLDETCLLFKPKFLGSLSNSIRYKHRPNIQIHSNGTTQFLNRKPVMKMETDKYTHAETYILNQATTITESNYDGDHNRLFIY